ncbi:hypothetical protein BWQ96_06390 [Gracilariopsis chorda]|uniref:Uncharacterized protein n=1 Tax=Gracilariopsis chorda TaxID=448386 RepID=A0A2V3IP50_9FLOR|nr:hypothetical protein BWQ96_06390 [Gracilariopsis chorda]|eukprot:PXF43844.1 hypothetical protein BWQ96_06390 [Gracilariopsis chorda]
MCAYVQINPLKLNSTVKFIDLLNDACYWSLNPPQGTGRPLQMALIVNEDYKGHVERETENQLQSMDDAAKDVLDAVRREVKYRLDTHALKPNALDLALVCAAVLSAIMAIDSVEIHKCLIRIGCKLNEEQIQPIRKIMFYAMAVLIAGSPSLITVSVIILHEDSEIIWEIYPNEITGHFYGSAWHAMAIWSYHGYNTVEYSYHA